MIGGHEHDAALLRCDAIKRIQQARERDAAALAIGATLTIFEDSIHILKQYDCVGWSLAKVLTKRVVSQ